MLPHRRSADNAANTRGSEVRVNAANKQTCTLYYNLHTHTQTCTHMRAHARTGRGCDGRPALSGRPPAADVNRCSSHVASQSCPDSRTGGAGQPHLTRLTSPHPPPNSFPTPPVRASPPASPRTPDSNPQKSAGPG